MTWGLQPKRMNEWAYFEDGFSNEEIEKIIHDAEKTEAKKAQVGTPEGIGKINEEVRKTEVSWILPCKDNEWLFRKITDQVLTVNANWFGFDLVEIEDLQFSKYYVGGFYDKHVDHYPETYGNPRKLSFVVQLSDPETYEGGSTLLWTSKTSQKIMKKKGSVTFFPSYLLHEVEPVTAGTRLALVGWVQGPPFK